MANWTITWVPDYGMQAITGYNTAQTSLGAGVEQRRSLWTARRRRFVLSFNAYAKSTIDAIRVFFEARAGAYEAFTFPIFGQQITGTRLACVDGGAGVDTITDSSSAFLTNDFQTGKYCTIAGSGAGNDGVKALHTSTAVIAGTLTFLTATLAAETANAALTVYPTVNVRFASDELPVEFFAPSLVRVATLELVEVL